VFGEAVAPNLTFSYNFPKGYYKDILRDIYNKAMTDFRSPQPNGEMYNDYQIGQGKETARFDSRSADKIVNNKDTRHPRDRIALILVEHLPEIMRGSEFFYSKEIDRTKPHGENNKKTNVKGYNYYIKKVAIERQNKLGKIFINEYLAKMTVELYEKKRILYDFSVVSMKGDDKFSDVATYIKVGGDLSAYKVLAVNAKSMPSPPMNTDKYFNEILSSKILHFSKINSSSQKKAVKNPVQTDKHSIAESNINITNDIIKLSLNEFDISFLERTYNLKGEALYEKVAEEYKKYEDDPSSFKTRLKSIFEKISKYIKNEWEKLKRDGFPLGMSIKMTPEARERFKEENSFREQFVRMDKLVREKYAKFPQAIEKYERRLDFAGRMKGFSKWGKGMAMFEVANEFFDYDKIATPTGDPSTVLSLDQKLEYLANHDYRDLSNKILTHDWALETYRKGLYLDRLGKEAEVTDLRHRLNTSTDLSDSAQERMAQRILDLLAEARQLQAEYQILPSSAGRVLQGHGADKSRIELENEVARMIQQGYGVGGDIGATPTSKENNAGSASNEVATVKGAIKQARALLKKYKKQIEGKSTFDSKGDLKPPTAYETFLVMEYLSLLFHPVTKGVSTLFTAVGGAENIINDSVNLFVRNLFKRGNIKGISPTYLKKGLRDIMLIENDIINTIFLSHRQFRRR
jgi:hypothetical protein